MMGWSPGCYISNYVEICRPVPEKKIFEGFLPCMGNLVQINTVVSVKIQFEFCMYTTLGQGQEMTLTFNTPISSYIQLDVCSNYLLAAIVSENSTVITFSYRKA